MLKFRTMKGTPAQHGEGDADWAESIVGANGVDTGADAAHSSGGEPPAQTEDRRTGFGRLLRRLSVDELPQFWNVLKGDCR